MHLKRKKNASAEDTKVKISMKSIFPWFILGFLAMVGINSLGWIPANVSSSLKEISKFLMVAALAAIGLGTNFKDMKKAGPAPMIHGFIISLLVVLVSIGIIILENNLGML